MRLCLNSPAIKFDSNLGTSGKCLVVNAFQIIQVDLITRKNALNPRETPLRPSNLEVYCAPLSFGIEQFWQSGLDYERPSDAPGCWKPRWVPDIRPAKDILLIYINKESSFTLSMQLASVPVVLLLCTWPHLIEAKYGDDEDVDVL